ncbi:MAG: DUF5615 family PIN-like protein [Verrucomicrobia bacterium]|nr:DUF5615 family PIN-like protein [Verrucomicrobiota bacterium]MDA1086821.1 DUF5615 family PIN-like protein [Verrucomicrobiota bacterium]
MNFLVDAHLPPSLCAVLRVAGHDACHTRDLDSGNRTPDPEINALSVREQRVVITKDTDFCYSCVLHGAPWNLVLVRTGNISTRDLVTLFEKNLPALLESLADSTILEIDRASVQVVH